MNKKAILIVVLSIFFSFAWSMLELDLESGAIFTGYNDVRIPGDSGTMFSLKNDLSTDVEPYIRAKIYYHFNIKHHLSVLYAPLTIKSKGTTNTDIMYMDEVFIAGADITSMYKFNSYRFTYRYDFVRKKDFTFGLGFTAKIREALISLENSDKYAEKTNVGFVPIINFRLNWMFIEDLAFILEGDALAAPQGRAEDVSVSINYNVNEKLGLKLGYRLLEGGSDIDEVYTFALFHYAALGLLYKF